MTSRGKTSTTKSLSDSGRCACCGAVTDCPLVDELEGVGFCSNRCYSAWHGRIDDYIRAAKLTRHGFERPPADRLEAARQRDGWLGVWNELNRMGDER